MAFIGYTRHRVGTCKPKSGIVVTQLLRGSTESLHESPLFKVALPTVGHDQCHRSTNTGDHSQTCPKGVQLNHTVYTTGTDLTLNPAPEILRKPEASDCRQQDRNAQRCTT
ncbi:hypothetical protein [Mycobacteroides abscessus]|uniref:hypothetical protein n=1 Tax=Mycobacteroides abscessus TaxID=36809 RepID=UPI0019295218|nr:hypothetical protein [Mycobacteroides abscessus]MBL3752697.1 hypothetical protein [Mycobacteroides abscessus subsp. massiliense]